MEKLKQKVTEGVEAETEEDRMAQEGVEVNVVH